MIGNLFIIFILFQNIILKYIPTLFSYWDEACLVLFFILYIPSLRKKKLQYKECIYFMILIGIVVVGLIGNIFWDYAYSVSAIVRDIVGFIKFPLAFLIFMRLSEDFKILDKMYKCIPFFKGIVYIIFISGLASLYFDLGMSQSEIRAGIHPFMFLYTHPTYLTSGMIFLLCILNAAREATLLYDFMLTVIVVLSMRTKGLAVIAVYIFLKYGGNLIKQFKVLYWTIIALLILIVSYNKLLLYTSFSNSPRESLYRGALQLVGKCFPFGTGFGTYASHISGKYLSKVYDFISIAGMYNDDGSVSVVIGDSGFPYYIGQFGVIGCLLIGYLIYCMFKHTIIGIEKNNRLPILLIWVMIFVSLTSESILINNGFEIGCLLAVISKMCIIEQDMFEKNVHNNRLYHIKYNFPLKKYTNKFL